MNASGRVHGVFRFIPGADHVISKLMTCVNWFSGWGFALALAIALVGCGAPGEGTIKVDPGVREKVPGATNAPPTKKLSTKQAKVQDTIDAAVKKNPKLQ
jgi:hypothetical protein